MFYDITCILVLTNRKEVRVDMVVEATSGDDAVKAAQTALRETEVYREHKNQVARELVVGVYPTPVTLPPLSNLAPSDGRLSNLATSDGSQSNLAPSDGRLSNLAAAAIEGAEATLETPKPLNKPKPRAK